MLFYLAAFNAASSRPSLIALLTLHRVYSKGLETHISRNEPSANDFLEHPFNTALFIILLINV